MKYGTPASNSLWPGRLDLLQSASGLLLALFMWLHMFFVSSILLGKETFWYVARFFEGQFILGRPYPLIVSLFVALIALLIALHALLALRKFPADWKQYRAIWYHTRSFKHGDTTLWLIQVATGFSLFFLASIHLYAMFSQPELIGPYASSDRVWSQNFWPLYLVLLFAVEIHAVVGLYRLCLKWGWFLGSDPTVGRRRLRRVKWALSLFFILLGLATLGAYIKIGMEHAPMQGERYSPPGIEVTR